MKHSDFDRADLGAESGDETLPSTAALEARLRAVRDRLHELGDDEAGALQRADLKKDMGYLLIALERGKEAWDTVRETLDVFVQNEQWGQAVAVCDILFRAEQDQSLSALGQGVWMAVTFPIDPELTVTMLQHIVDETPDDSDGAAVAAATAAYVVDLRAEGKQHDDLSFFTMQMLGSVARRHSDVRGEADFTAWLKKLELTEPAKFLIRLRNVIDVLVQGDWWFDRDALQSKLPLN